MSNTPNYRLPVKRQPTPPPAVWRQAAPVVARGAALVAAGVIGEWLLRSATKKAVSLPFQARKNRKQRALAKQEGRSGLIAYSETVVVRRTVIREG
jgi:hypothetical protein